MTPNSVLYERSSVDGVFRTRPINRRTEPFASDPRVLAALYDQRTGLAQRRVMEGWAWFGVVRRP